MTLILPKHVAAQLRKTHAEKSRVPGYEATRRHALDSDDFLDPSDVAAQLKRFIEYDGAVPKPVGWRVSVLLLTIPEETAGGVIMNDGNIESRSVASPQGIVLALGESAYTDPVRFPRGPWVRAGDRVVFQKYSGRMFQIRTGQHIAFLNDTDFAGYVDRDWLEFQHEGIK